MMKKPGHVYVLLEPLVSTGSLVKIGFTGGTTEKRAAALFGTGRAYPLIVLWDEYVREPERLEKELHDHFEMQRANKRREFFHVTPKEAIGALVRLAGPYRVSAVRAKDRVNVLPGLREKFGNIFYRDLQAADLIVTEEGGVQLEMTRRSGSDTTVATRSVDFIYDEDAPWFSAELSVEDNAQRLLELDELSLVMIGGLVSDDDSVRIDCALNPPRTERKDLTEAAETGMTPPPF